MRYLSVAWEHDHPDEPITLYSECDDAGWELRKLEIFRDGRVGFASAVASSEGSRLGLEPIPDIEKLATQEEFRPSEISKEEFEAAWSAAQLGFAAPTSTE